MRASSMGGGMRNGVNQSEGGRKGGEGGTDLRTKIPRQSTRHICFLRASFRLLGMTVVVTGSGLYP